MNRPRLASLTLIVFGPLAYQLGKIRGLDETNSLALLIVCFIFGGIGLLISILNSEPKEKKASQGKCQT